MAETQLELVHQLLDVASARWTIDVLAVMRDERMRFNEVLRTVDGISQKQLTATLRTLQRNGFVSRMAFATIPPRVEYEVTALSRLFSATVRPLGTFAEENYRDIETARRAFDGGGL